MALLGVTQSYFGIFRTQKVSNYLALIIVTGFSLLGKGVSLGKGEELNALCSAGLKLEVPAETYF